jgi:poly(A) polymerase
MLKLFKKNKNKLGKIFSNKNLGILFDCLGKDSSKFFLVGGAVRNYLINEKVTDFDIAAQMPPKQLENLLIHLRHKHKITIDLSGKQFGCFKIELNGEKFEITSFRKDTYTDGSRFPKISYTNKMLDDAHRRDFTINAIYMNCEGEIIYPVKQSKIDIEDLMIRFINPARESINNDPLRILRFLRFASEYEVLMMDKKDLRMCWANRNLLRRVGVKKKKEEIEKIRRGTNYKNVVKYIELN